jgi:hypothetical protein
MAETKASTGKEGNVARYTPTAHQREILKKLSQGVKKWVIGYVPTYERAWLQQDSLPEESLRVRTFNTLRDNGWLEEIPDYPEPRWIAGAKVYTISKAGRRKLGVRTNHNRT